MDELFKKIYQEVICNERDMYESGRRMENEVNEMVAAYKDKLSEGERERLLEQIDQAVSSAKQGGFYFGVRFAVRGLVLLLADEKK